MKKDETLGRRREPRFKTEDKSFLQCDCFHEDEDPRHGGVIDMSTHGLRFICEGDFRVGQVVLIELKTDRSHGAFGGIIRRANPWVKGQTVYGCELVEPLTDDVLETLAQEGVVNRRGEQRINWNQPAKMSWELQADEVDIEIEDCSIGGLKINSQTKIPENVNLRIRVSAKSDESDSADGQEESQIDARTVWQKEHDEGYLVGLSFRNGDLPPAVTQILEQGEPAQLRSVASKRPRSIRPSILVAATIVVVCVTLLQTRVFS